MVSASGDATVNSNVVANMAAYAVITQKKILGADYGLSVIFPVVNTRFTANLFDASAESAGLGTHKRLALTHSASIFAASAS